MWRTPGTINAAVSYEHSGTDSIKVYLDNHHVGTIIRKGLSTSSSHSAGYAYRPKGGNKDGRDDGATFATLGEVKRSLESDE